jgi:hypothetical protein
MKSKSGKIILNTTIIYTDGIKEQFEAVLLNEKGAIIGRIINEEFVICGFIPKRNIKKINSRDKTKRVQRI